MVETLRARLPEVEDLIDQKIEEMSFWDQFTRSSFHDDHIAPEVENWLQALRTELETGIAESAAHSETLVYGTQHELAWSWSEIAGASAATAATVAPFALLPFAASIATVTSTSFLVFSTSAVSLPILSLVVGGVLVTGIGGQTVRKKAFDYFIENYREQVKEAARTKVIGAADATGEASLQSYLLDGIDAVARSRLDRIQ